jgi:iron complex transport system ATP-binding protein
MVVPIGRHTTRAGQVSPSSANAAANPAANPAANAAAKALAASAAANGICRPTDR